MVFEFKDNLVYKVSSNTTRDTWRNYVSKQIERKKKEKEGRKKGMQVGRRLGLSSMCLQSQSWTFIIYKSGESQRLATLGKMAHSR